MKFIFLVSMIFVSGLAFAKKSSSLQCPKDTLAKGSACYGTPSMKCPEGFTEYYIDHEEGGDGLICQSNDGKEFVPRKFAVCETGTLSYMDYQDGITGVTCKVDPVQ